MKKIILAFATLAIITVSCQNSNTKTDNTTASEDIVTEETTVVTLVEFDDVVGDLVGKTIAISGTADHICRHGGQRMFIVDTDAEGRVKITPDENVAAFNSDLEGQTLLITGVVEEQRIDEAYLREWEEEILADADMGDDKGEGAHLGGNVEKGGSEADKSEEMEKVNNLREQLVKSGEDHLSFYSVLCTEYEIVDDSK